MVPSVTEEPAGHDHTADASPHQGKTKTLVAVVLAGALAVGLLGAEALSALTQAGASTYTVMTAEFMHAQDNAG